MIRNFELYRQVSYLKDLIHFVLELRTLTEVGARRYYGRNGTLNGPNNQGRIDQNSMYVCINSFLVNKRGHSMDRNQECY